MNRARRPKAEEPSPRKRPGAGKKQTAPKPDPLEFMFGMLAGLFGLGRMPNQNVPPPRFQCKSCGSMFWGIAAMKWCPVCGFRHDREQWYGGSSVEPSMRREQAAIFLASWSVIPKDDILASEACLRKAYKIAAARCHPDVPGGSHEQFCKLQEAMEVLR